LRQYIKGGQENRSFSPPSQSGAKFTLCCFTLQPNDLVVRRRSKTRTALCI